MESSPANFTCGTGANIYDFAWLSRDEMDAEQKRTQISPTNISDPVLRDVLVAFQGGLIHQFADMTSRIAMAWAPDLATEIQVSLADYAGMWLPAALFSSSTIQAIPNNFCAVLNAIEVWESNLPILPETTSGKLASLAKLSSRKAINTPIAVEAVEDISNWFGLPAADVLKSVGIKKRTYQEWKRSGTRRPRPSSEGRLWELHQLAADLKETLTLKGIRHWFAHDPRRRLLLRNGEFDRLVSLAYETKVTPRPAWVGAGSIESHAVERQSLKLDRMDPGDIAEPD